MMKTCPLCQAESGFSEIMFLNSLHDFLRVLSPINSKNKMIRIMMKSRDLMENIKLAMHDLQY